MNWMKINFLALQLEVSKVKAFLINTFVCTLHSSDSLCCLNNRIDFPCYVNLQRHRILVDYSMFINFGEICFSNDGYVLYMLVFHSG